MRLFLSSEKFGNYPHELSRLVGENKKVAYISNAKDYISRTERAAKVAEHKALFEELGFKFIELDLRQYFDHRVTAQDLDGFGLVWAAGGNTFLLRRAMYDSGFDEVLVDLLKQDHLVYGGSSAGSIVATPSLKGVEHGDDPGQVQAIYGQDIIWDGLNLLPKHLVVHYKSDWFGAEAQMMVDYFEENSMEFRILKDGQVCIVDGGDEELLD